MIDTRLEHCKVPKLINIETRQPSEKDPELHAFFANPRSRQAAVTLLYSSRNIFKPGMVETLSDNAKGNTMNSTNNSINIVKFSLENCKKVYLFYFILMHMLHILMPFVVNSFSLLKKYYTCVSFIGNCKSTLQ